MRIIGGKYRGKKLFTPENNDVRPTADRAREAVFNILASKLENRWTEYNLLDVFSGTGAFALEALSRGVNSICLIDKNTKLSAKNAGLFPQEKEYIKLITADALSLPPASRRYNLIFMDAPYQKGLSAPALAELYDKGWLDEVALCIVEVEKTEKLNIPETFDVLDERIYGLAKFFFLRLKNI